MEACARCYPPHPPTPHREARRAELSRRRPVGEIADAAYLDRLKGEYVEMAPYFTAAMHALAAHPELHVLSHVNLQIDNAWFWRSADADGAGEAVLECGLLDWYNASRVPAVSVFMGCLSGIEPEVLAAHEEGRDARRRRRVVPPMSPSRSLPAGGPDALLRRRVLQVRRAAG